VGIYFPDYERRSGTVTWHRTDFRATISRLETRIAKFSIDTGNHAHIFSAADATTFEARTNSRSEATTPVNAASLDAWTTNRRALGSYSGTTLRLSPPTPRSPAAKTLPRRSSSKGHGLVSVIGKARALDATLRATNDALDVLVPNLPIGAALSLNARTSNDVASL